MKKILFLILISLQVRSQQTNIPVLGWNCYTHLPASYDGIKKYPAIIFFPGLGEVGTNAAAVISNGPGAYITQGWQGVVNDGASSTEFIILSLQPPVAWPSEDTIKRRIDTLLSWYRIDTTNIFLTGLSHGGWCATSFVSDPVKNYALKIRAVVGVESVLPAWDNAPWPQSYGNFALNRRTLIFEQVLDYRAGDQLVTYINNAMNGNGIFVQTNFAGGCHCAWEYFYGGHGRAPELFDLDGYNQNIYQWMTRQLVNKNSVNPSNILQLQSKKKRKFILQF